MCDLYDFACLVFNKNELLIISFYINFSHIENLI